MKKSAEDIFAEALGLTDPAARAACLDRACGGEAQLRCEFESLLRAHEQAGDFLRQTMKLTEADFVSEETGMKIGRYKLLEQIGEGGFGRVSAFMCIILLLTGCVFPSGRVVTSGHRYSKAEIAFLSQPGASREEATASLGPPSWESQSSRVLLYLWTTSRQWNVFLGAAAAGFLADNQRRALLIAYDERGLVTDHAVCTIGQEELEEACANWAASREKRR